MGSMLMANGEECLDGWVGAGRGEVKDGGVNFGVILLGEIPGESTGESVGEYFGVEGEAVCFEWCKTTFGMVTSMGIRHVKPYTFAGAFDETRVKVIQGLATQQSPKEPFNLIEA
ncbi:hypothetical protein Tco_0845720 [Tanacetum coccineum]